MRYKVVRDCHGFMGRYWLANTIVDSTQFAAKWPTDPKEIPRHFVQIDNAGVEVEQPKVETFSMTEFSKDRAQKPETVSNVKLEDAPDQKVASNKKATKKK